MDGNTFFQNRAYISLQSASATVVGCGAVGKTYVNQIITVQTSDLYSVCRNGPYLSSVLQYNLADLQAPVPASAWACQPFCWFQDSMHAPPSSENASYVTAGTSSYGIYPQKGGYCAHIIADQAYRPLLAVPLQIRGLDPAWSSCALDLFGLYDPPIALTADATVASATLPSFIHATTTTTATPGPGIAPTLVPPSITSLSSAQGTTAKASSVAVAQSDVLPSDSHLGPAGPEPTVNSIIPTSRPVLEQETITVHGTSDWLIPIVVVPPSTTPIDALSTASRPLALVTGFVVGSQTLTVDGPALTLSGSTFTALPSDSGLQIVASGKTSVVVAAPVGTIGGSTAQSSGPFATTTATATTLPQTHSGSESSPTTSKPNSGNMGAYTHSTLRMLVWSAMIMMVLINI